MRTRKLLSLERRAIKLQREVLKIVDKIYEADEVFGEAVNETLQDETFLRSEK